MAKRIAPDHGPRDTWVYSCCLTEAEVRSVARGEIPETLVEYCRDAIPWLDGRIADGLQADSTRRTHRGKEIDDQTKRA